MTDDEVVAEMERRFGAGDTEQYMRLARATRSLVAIWAAYAQTPDGSVAEAFMEQRLNQMLDGMKTRPEHSVGMIESLLALVYHMKLGGTYEEWFQSIGIAPEPGGDGSGTEAEAPA